MSTRTLVAVALATATLRLTDPPGATLVGTLPGIFLKVYVGAAGREAWGGGPLEWSLLAVGIVAG